MAYRKALVFGVLVCALVTYFIYCDQKCKEYGWRNAILTSKGVFCERTVSSSYEIPYLPLEGVRRQFEYFKREYPGSNKGDL